MEAAAIVNELARNRTVFGELLRSRSEAAQRWRPAPAKWSRLEIVCHLYDEEREDFRARVEHTLATPELPAPAIDPEGWVIARNYAGADYAAKVAAFLHEREASVAWLQSLDSPRWDRTYRHPALGSVSARMFLSNWLAHDYLHIRQLVRYDYQVLKHASKEDLTYAGDAGEW